MLGNNIISKHHCPIHAHISYLFKSNSTF